MDETLLNQINEKADRLISQPNSLEMLSLENQLSEYIGQSQEQPELRAELSQIRSKIYKTRLESERRPSFEKIQTLLNEKRFLDALQAVGLMIESEIIRSEHVELLRTILVARPEMRSEIRELLKTFTLERLSSDAQILLEELNQTSSPPMDRSAQQSVGLIQSGHVSQKTDLPPENQIQSQANFTHVNNIVSDDAMTKGDGAFYSGKLDEAAAWYERALDIDPSRERARKRLRDISEGRIPGVAIPPEAGQAYGRALSLYRRGKYSEAAVETQVAIELMGGLQWKDAQELLNASFSGQQAEAAYNDGLKKEDEGQWNAALREYDAAIAILPDNSVYPAARDRLRELIWRASEIRTYLRPAYRIDELVRLQDAQEHMKLLEQETTSKLVKELQAEFDADRVLQNSEPTHHHQLP